MKNFSILISLLLLLACQGQNSTNKEQIKELNNNSIMKSEVKIDTLSDKIKKTEKLKVLVLPPYDEIANQGISPGVQEYLQNELKKCEKINLIKLPLRQLMNIPYQNVFDKKYCQPIIETIDCDIIVMSKLDLVKQTGHMPRDEWNLRIRLYNTQTDIQINSELKVNSLSLPGIKKVLGLTNEIIIKEIENTVNDNY